MSSSLNAFAFIVCSLEVAWGIIQILFHNEIVEKNYITDSFARLLQADYVYQVSSAVLLACAATLFINTVSFFTKYTLMSEIFYFSWATS